MNVLIVESKNDEYFVEALVRNNKSKTNAVSIDEYKYYSLSSEEKLATTIENVFNEAIKKGTDKVGIILDLDNKTKTNKISLINNSIKKALAVMPDSVFDNLLSDINKFETVTLNEETEIKVACYFTNVDGKGELEDILKAIVPKDANTVFADCLYEGWKNCFENKGKKLVRSGESGGDITDKELKKLWVDFYKRFDTLNKKERKQAEKNTEWKTVMLGRVDSKGKTIAARGKQIFNLDATILDNLKDFIKMFD